MAADGNKFVNVQNWMRPTSPKGDTGKINNINGITPATWFSPLQPLPDFAPQDVQGRQWDYQVGYNVLIQPRPLAKITFAQLRALYYRCDIMQTIINSRKDQIASAKWSIKYREGNKSEQKKRAETDPRIAELMQFFRKPDKVNTWDQWLRQWLEDLFVIDAPALYVRRDKAGGIFGIEVMDGATIALNIDQNGRRPLPPDPAFKQYLKGVDAVSYTTDQLIYMPRNLVTNDVYGRSPIEMTWITVNAAINRAVFNQNYYLEGNIPDAIAALPENFTADQVSKFTQWWDSMYAGNLANRRKVMFVPGDPKFTPMKEPEMKNAYDDYIARVLCHIIGVSPQPFISEVNRATAETAKETSDEVGANSIEQAVKNMVDHVIQDPAMFGYGDIEFSFEVVEDTDPKVQAEILSMYVDKGIFTRDMALEKLGEDPAGGICAERTITTAGGILTLDQAIEQNEQALEAPDIMGAGIADGEEGETPAEPLGSDTGTPAKKRAIKKKFLPI